MGLWIGDVGVLSQHRKIVHGCCRMRWKSLSTASVAAVVICGIQGMVKQTNKQANKDCRLFSSLKDHHAS